MSYRFSSEPLFEATSDSNYQLSKELKLIVSLSILSSRLLMSPVAKGIWSSLIISLSNLCRERSIELMTTALDSLFDLSPGFFKASSILMTCCSSSRMNKFLSLSGSASSRIIGVLPLSYMVETRRELDWFPKSISILTTSSRELFYTKQYTWPTSFDLLTK